MVDYAVSPSPQILSINPLENVPRFIKSDLTPGF
jgi:hypothetical protein